MLGDRLSSSLPGRWFLSTKRTLLSHISPAPILRSYGSHWEQLSFLLIFPTTLPLCPFDRLLFSYVFPDYSTPCLRISVPHKVLKTTFFDDFSSLLAFLFILFFLVTDSLVYVPDAPVFSPSPESPAERCNLSPTWL